MKIIITVLCLFAAAAMAQQYQQRPPNFEQQARAAQQQARACQMQEHATEADIKEFQQQQKPSTHTAKCMHACLMESIGLIENGKLSVKNSVEFISRMVQGNNNELIKIVEEISTECFNVIKETDRCELAFMIMTCTEDGMRKRRVDMQKYLPRRPQHQQSPQHQQPPQYQQSPRQ